MAQQNEQDIQQIHHSLSRLALAKAIKTPHDEESEPWQKSVIFSQPFIKDLHTKKQQLYTNPPSHKKPHKNRPTVNSTPKDHSSSSSIDKRLSELNIKKSTTTEPTNKQRSCLPSDTEEEEEDSEEEEEDEDDSELFEVKRPERPSSTSQVQVIPTSHNSSRDDVSTPSRGSTSSNTLPLTDEDEGDSAPTAQLHHAHSNSWTIPHATSDNNPYSGPQQKPSYYYANNMMDPMYYQRVQQYQQQLQYQIQYQQALALQQQQQQMYMLSQSPSAFFPPGSRVMDDSAPSTYHRRNSSGLYHQHQQHGRSNGGHKMSKTDLRRREEMIRSSNESMHRHPSPSQQQYYQQQYFTPSIMKNNNRRPSYNL